MTGHGAGDAPLRVVVSVGTGPYPFDRLVRAVDAWAQDWGELHHRPVDLWVQHGHSEPPQRGQAVRTVVRGELVDRFLTADVLVTHGGAATVLDANAVGRRPIVVPRRRYLREHEDDHQLTSGLALADQGHVWLAPTVPEVAIQLSRMAADPATGVVPPRQHGTRAAALRLEHELDRITGTSRPAGTTLRRFAALTRRRDEHRGPRPSAPRHAR
ncbi:glycosyltransferase [Promicromonospora sp. MS192]|uniref:glycosyltransferase n=1 Tax=Promicromonospora sp. MS192 TaxID=3412684 RepID=UPI003C3054BE